MQKYVLNIKNIYKIFSINIYTPYKFFWYYRGKTIMQTQIASPNSAQINLCSGSMRYDGDGDGDGDNDCETQPTEYSSATTHHSPKHDHLHTRKKRRLALETETPIQLPNRQTRHHTPPNSNRFNFSSHTHSHRKCQHWKSSARTETPRKWVFSSRDFSNCKGP